MKRFERNVAVVCLSLFVLYWGYRMLFQPIQISYPVFNVIDNMIIWKTEKVDAPIPKFIKKYKKRLYENHLAKRPQERT